MDLPAGKVQGEAGCCGDTDTETPPAAVGKLNLPKHRSAAFQSGPSHTLSLPTPAGRYGDLTLLWKVNAGTTSNVSQLSKRA
ncbi:hypothetical protein F2P81_019624 [Scophthalmus maximus]|uniref:Uncharacterized protein n=1 Tax=Scophthalmus maximus TaxID=52904 RepID=A0A6A4S649_SCOMX|nr:hypothetical protein F2P81_019624 [Scophthalmus maximus]